MCLFSKEIVHKETILFKKSLIKIVEKEPFHLQDKSSHTYTAYAGNFTL